MITALAVDALAVLGVVAVSWAARRAYRPPRPASTEPWTSSSRTADDVWNDAQLQRIRNAAAADGDWIDRLLADIHTLPETTREEETP